MKQYLNFKSFLFDCFDATSGCRVLIYLGFSRSSGKHDSTLLQSTDLFKIIVGGEMIPNVVQQLEDIEIPLFCVTEPSRCEY